MDFAFTEEQQMIRDTAAAFLAGVSDSGAVRRAMATELGYEEPLWRRICEEMYWQAMHIPEEYGGLGLGYVELVATLEQMGRYLLCAPFYSTVCLAANALRVAGSEKQQAEYLPQLAEGLTATLAWQGSAEWEPATHPRARWDAEAVQVRCRRDGEHYVLNGSYRYVIDGHSAGLLVLAARAEDSQGEQGISLFLVPADSEGIERHWLPTMDQTRRQARIVLRDLRVPVDRCLGEEGAAWPALAKVIDLAAIALAAEQAGGAQQVLDMSVEYARERVQFGRPVASFQAIKHKAADMMLRVEAARSAIYFAACVAEEALSGDESGNSLAEAAAIAKAYCSEAYFFNAGCAIQIHGGVGFTWEYDVHLYFKRAKSSEAMFGDGAWHRERVARMILDQK